MLGKKNMSTAYVYSRWRTVKNQQKIHIFVEAKYRAINIVRHVATGTPHLRLRPFMCAGRGGQGGRGWRGRSCSADFPPSATIWRGTQEQKSTNATRMSTN